MVAKFNKLIAPKEYNWKLEDILPKVLSAGENAGVLTPEGSKKLEMCIRDRPSVVLEPGQTYNSECIFKFSVEK